MIHGTLRIQYRLAGYVTRYLPATLTFGSGGRTIIGGRARV